MIRSILVLIAAFSFSAVASDSTGDTGVDGKALEFAAQPVKKGSSEKGSVSAVDYERPEAPVGYWDGSNSRPTRMTCAQAKSRSPYAFKGCGYGYTAVRAYVGTTDKAHCFVGFDCVIDSNGSNN
jgi:hypothetical protein